MRTLEEAFKMFDVDKSGQVSFKEFSATVERFGLHVAGGTAGMGGIPIQTLQVLRLSYCHNLRAMADREEAECKLSC